MKNLCINDRPEFIKETLDILGDKYSALMLFMLYEKPRRFKDFEASIEGISPRTLSQRLTMLEDKGIIVKETCPDSPGRCQYELTEAGRGLDKVVHAMATWGMKYLDNAENCIPVTQKKPAKSPLIKKI